MGANKAIDIPDIDVEINNKLYQLCHARIDSTMLGIEDHGIMTFNLGLDYFTGGFQGAGLASLDSYDKATKKRKGLANSILLLRDILEIVGVSEWEQLKGQHVLAIKDRGWGGLVRGLSKLGGTDYILWEDYYQAGE